MQRPSDVTAALAYREAGPDDADLVGALIHAVDTHYIGERAPSAADAAAMFRKMSAIQEGTHFTLAFEGGKPVGIAGWVAVRPGHRLGGALYIKDLFVVAEARGRGIGQAFLAELARIARERGLARIDLTTDHENFAAQRFYEGLGGKVQAKVMYRFEGEVLERLADS